MAEPVYSYSHSPSTSTTDAVRHLIGDTDPDGKGEWQLTNQEIDYEVTTLGSVTAAAVACAETIAARYARKVTKTSSGTVNQTHALSDLYDHYIRLAQTLRTRTARGGVPLIGGISEARKELVVDDEDRVDPAFEGMTPFENV